MTGYRSCRSTTYKGHFTVNHGYTHRCGVTAGSACRNVFVWDFDSRRVLYKLPGHDGAVNETSFHPTEPIVGSAGSDGKIFLGELAD